MTPDFSTMSLGYLMKRQQELRRECIHAHNFEELWCRPLPKSAQELNDEYIALLEELNKRPHYPNKIERATARKQKQLEKQNR